MWFQRKPTSLTKTDPPHRKIAYTKNYALELQYVYSPTFHNGVDTLYSITNADTMVTEYRTGNLPDGLDTLLKMQVALNTVRQAGSGEVSYIE